MENINISMQKFDQVLDIWEKMAKTIEMKEIMQIEPQSFLNVGTSNAKTTFKIFKGCKRKDYSDCNAASIWYKVKTED
jgi:hypothetical protein